MRNKRLQAAVLSIVAFLSYLIVWIIKLRSEGFSNLHWWYNIAFPIGLFYCAYLCWLMLKAYFEDRAKPPQQP